VQLEEKRFEVIKIKPIGAETNKLPHLPHADVNLIYELAAS